MKRYVAVLLITVMVALGLTGCAEETVPKEKDLDVLQPVNGNILEKSHEIEDFKFVTTYDTGDYGFGSISQKRLTEKNLVQEGDVYANKMQVVYDILIKYAGEDFYHVVSILDEFLIPVEYEAEESE